MKKAAKIFFILITLVLTMAAAGLLMLRHAEGADPIVPEEPLVTVTFAGSIARNSTAFRHFSEDPDALTDAWLIARYENPQPGDREAELLANAGFSAVTLPYLSDEDYEYLLEQEGADRESDSKQNRSVLILDDIPNTVILNLSLELDRDEVIRQVSAYGETVIVAFTAEGKDWDDMLFSELARVAVDHGARVVVGNHHQPNEIEIYEDGVIIPGLDGLLGGRNTSGAIVSVAVYDTGITVEVQPLEVSSGMPVVLTMPWHYLRARAILNNFTGNRFERRPFKAVYASPSLITPESTGGEDDVDDEEPVRPSPVQGHAVAAGHPLAVEAGMQILEAGGNAVDAAVAVAYALAVVEPDGSGLGGGGIMLMHLSGENRQVVIDYRETAPSTADRDEIRQLMNGPATGIPGFVRGLEKAINDYGTIPYADAIHPAYLLAKDGFTVTNQLNSRLRTSSGKIARSPDALRDFFRNGWPKPAGQTVTQPTLARTLENIMAEGSTVFYGGYINDSIIEVLQRQGVTVTRQDLRNYQPVVRTPVTGEYRGYTIVTVPPPAGGFNVLQQLKILDHFDLSGYTPKDAEVYRLIEQTMKSTYSDRRNYVGDPNFVHVELDELLSDRYITEKVNQIHEGTVPLHMYTDPYRPSDNTTHFVVVDGYGNWVSVTNTLSYSFGNGLQAEGFFLNTQLNNFSLDPSSPNYYQAGKRPYSHISPVMVFADGVPVLAMGSPGGRKIPSILTQVLVLHIDFNLPIAEAVDQPRFWSEGKTLWVETGMPKAVSDMFRRKGYEIITLTPRAYFGRAASVYYDRETDSLTGSGDPRRGDGEFRTQ